MAIHLPIRFPSEAESLRKQWEAQRGWTPQQRLWAVADTLAAVDALADAGGMRTAHLKYQQSLEEEWQRRMKEFIRKHVSV